MIKIANLANLANLQTGKCKIGPAFSVLSTKQYYKNDLIKSKKVCNASQIILVKIVKIGLPEETSLIRTNETWKTTWTFTMVSARYFQIFQFYQLRNQPLTRLENDLIKSRKVCKASPSLHLLQTILAHMKGNSPLTYVARRRFVQD